MMLLVALGLGHLDLLEMVDELGGAGTHCRCSGIMDLSFAVLNVGGHSAIKEPFTLPLRGAPGVE